jgi:hypothetical protein
VVLTVPDTVRDWPLGPVNVVEALPEPSPFAVAVVVRPNVAPLFVVCVVPPV